MPMTDDDYYDRYRDAAAATGPWPRRPGRNGDNARNQARTALLNRLPGWMRRLEETLWLPGGGT